MLCCGNGLTAGSKGPLNSLNSVSTEPRSMSECDTFSSTLMMAWVAHALLITWTKFSDQRVKISIVILIIIKCWFYTNLYLFSKEYLLDSAVLDNRSLRLFTGSPLVQEYQSMNWPEWIFSKNYWMISQVQYTIMARVKYTLTGRTILDLNSIVLPLEFPGRLHISQTEWVAWKFNIFLSMKCEMHNLKWILEIIHYNVTKASN